MIGETMSPLATTALKAVCVRQIACHFLCRSVMTSKVSTGCQADQLTPSLLFCCLQSCSEAASPRIPVQSQKSSGPANGQDASLGGT